MPEMLNDHVVLHVRCNVIIYTISLNVTRFCRRVTLLSLTSQCWVDRHGKLFLSQHIAVRLWAVWQYYGVLYFIVFGLHKQFSLYVYLCESISWDCFTKILFMSSSASLFIQFTLKVLSDFYYTCFHFFSGLLEAFGRSGRFYLMKIIINVHQLMFILF